MSADYIRRHPGPLIVVVVAVLALVVVLSHEGAPEEGQAAVTPRPTEPALIDASETSTPEAAIPDDSVDLDRSTFEERVLDFEEAYNTPDTQQRLEALRPFATDEFLAALVVADNNSMASETSDGVTIVLDRDESFVAAEAYDETDASTMEVSTIVTITTFRNNTPIHTFEIRHITAWVMQPDGEWRVHSNIDY